MSYVMDPEARTAFLAAPHVAVLAIEREDRAPLAVPIWYAYEAGGDVLLWIDRDSVKDRALRAAGRFSLVVQSETMPYEYVSVEGPVTAASEPPTREQALGIARRYLSRDLAETYVSGALGPGSLLIRMRPDKWLSNDHSKD